MKRYKGNYVYWFFVIVVVPMMSVYINRFLLKDDAGNLLLTVPFAMLILVVAFGYNGIIRYVEISQKTITIAYLYRKTVFEKKQIKGFKMEKKVLVLLDGNGAVKVRLRQYLINPLAYAELMKDLRIKDTTKK